jgi:group II intron reverse transcriptase/maturase
MAFTTLAHHIDIELLVEAWRLVRKDGAVGVDGLTAADYQRDLYGNLRSLLDRFKSGTYRAPPVRRAFIPKGGGQLRPIGIPTIEDKLLQRAVAMVLEAVYEQDFRDCSYGFRPGRSAHDALQCLWQGLTTMRGGWVVDADIKGFFDTLDHVHLRSFLDRRVRDGVLRRVIGKWLSAGVLEEGGFMQPEAGTPQGGVISPLLANIYLHEVLDTWFEQEVKPRLRGDCFLVRYADDFVIACALEEDAHRIMEVLPKRFERFGLALHPQKTRLVRFTRPTERPGAKGKGPRPETFNLLGFTHYWGASRQGNRVVKRKTAKDRFRRAVKRIAEWCRDNRHLTIREQHLGLSRKLQGHDAYYRITGNFDALDRLRKTVRGIWRKWLNRRGGRHGLTWQQFHLLLRRSPLPAARVVHSALAPRAANP